MHQGNLPQNIVDNCHPEGKAARGTLMGGERSRQKKVVKGNHVRASGHSLVQAGKAQCTGRISHHTSLPPVHRHS